MSVPHYDLGDHSYSVTTSAPEAQTWFDRGLLWSYSFNHEEAVRCFETAVEHDPRCAMAHWGITYAVGPNYNKPWSVFQPDDLDTSIEYGNVALQRARAVCQDAKERALIEALAQRFPARGAPDDPEELHKLDVAYAEAMRPVYRAYSQDLDVAALFADALLCVSPRALWGDDGEPVGYGTVEANEVFAAAMALPGGKRHPALNHLYIHLMDMSAEPERALPAANALRHAVPDGTHMTHMSTHIDAACGDYSRAIESNQFAAARDDHYFAHQQRFGRYFPYRAHNLRFLAYSAMMAGRTAEALDAAHRLNAIITPEVLNIPSPPMADLCEGYHTTLPHVLIRFGHWQDILDLELPQDRELFAATTAMTLYAKGIAHASLGHITQAEEAREQFLTASAAVPETRWNARPAREIDVLKVAAAMLDGELEYRKGNVDEAFANLRRAIELEEQLPYTDPPAWLLPARHPYAALLLEQGHVAEAAAVYKADLHLDRSLTRWRAHPNNVWSLHGLHECLTHLGEHEQAQQIALQRDIAMGAADIPIAASCFCRLGAHDDGASCCSSASTSTTASPRKHAAEQEAHGEHNDRD